MKTLEQKLEKEILTINDFPKKGIAFKDLQSILSNPELVSDIVESFVNQIEKNVTVIVGLESRGFLFGMLIAKELGLPFVMLRKPGKLPPPVINLKYLKEYGSDSIEIREGVISENDKVHIHDDLLATGGSAKAAQDLIKKSGAEVSGFSFVMELPRLKGRDVLDSRSIVSLVKFNN
ncbi:MAG: adenine phosphoribosyltransferase [Candidatus Pacebacteria bacterium]|nr:adenine phosphoribosyltransferase [Candidatus Paceibacterota bacterium]